MTLKIVKKSSGGIYNNAAQVWNHTFFWNCVMAPGGGEPAAPLAEAINEVGRLRPSAKPSRRRRQLRLRLDMVGEEGRRQRWTSSEHGAAGTPLTTADKALLTVDVGTRPLASTNFQPAPSSWNLPSTNWSTGSSRRSQLRPDPRLANKKRPPVFMGAGFSGGAEHAPVQQAWCRA